MVGPEYSPPQLDIPCEWHAAEEGLKEDACDCVLFWEQFNDPILNCLIEKAATQNLDLSIAVARLLEARRKYEGASGAFYPHLDATANAGHLSYDKKILNRILTCESSNGRKNIDFFEFGFDAEWEIDLFGKLHHEKNALKAKFEASIEDFAFIQVTLFAEVAKNYMELRGFQQRLQRLEQEIYAQKETLELTDGLITSGFANNIDLGQIKEQLKLLEAEKPGVNFAIRKLIHRISILLGYPPAELYCLLEEIKPLPKLPCLKPLGVPSDLLRRRPDIRKAERELAASVEQVGSAAAALFPSITLRGFIGDVGTFCSGGGLTWLGGSSILMPLFNSRSLNQDLDINKLKAEEALFEYQKTVLSALEETENAIAAFHTELERSKHLEEACELSHSVYVQKLDLFKNGFKDYLDVLTTERSFLSEEKAYLESQVALLIDYIALYKSLGGCFEISHSE